MKKILFYFICLFVFLFIYFFINGYTKHEDVSNDESLFGEYKLNQDYVLKGDVFLLNLGADKSKLAIAPEGLYKSKHYYNVPESMTDYISSSSDAKWITGVSYTIPTTVKGIIKMGTTIRCVKFVKETEFSMFFGKSTAIIVYAEVMDGDFRGKIVNLKDASHRKLQNEIWLRSPNFDLLE